MRRERWVGWLLWRSIRPDTPTMCDLHSLMCCSVHPRRPAHGGDKPRRSWEGAMSEFFAWHITWTCYGTWLPGDPRGHVSNILLPGGGFERKRNTPGTPVMPGDAYTQDRARALQKYETVWLTQEQALIAAHALVD